MKYMHEGTVKKPELWEQLIDYTSYITGIKFRFIYYDDSRMIYMKAYTDTWKWKRVYVFDYGASVYELTDALSMAIKEYKKRECS